MENSHIAWCHHTHNWWVGCTKVSPGCDNCYAEALIDTRFGRVQWGPKGERSQTSEANRRKPIAWNQKAKDLGVRHRVFCMSLGDILDNQVPQEWRDEAWMMVEETPHLDWLFLTKRPQLFGSLAPVHWAVDGCPPNVWWGISVENQEEMIRRGRWLNQIEARVKFWSVEPMLGPLNTVYYPGPYRDGCPDVDWVICGGESGPYARAMDPAWVRTLRNEVQAWGGAFFFKQAGSVPWAWKDRTGTHRTTGKGDKPNEWPTDLQHCNEFPKPREWRDAA